MPPRSSSSLRSGGFSPPNDPATYRDILFFEERLKTTAVILQQRKHRYQLFLFQLLLVIAFLLSEVLAYTAVLSYPYTWVLRVCFPEEYARNAIRVPLHPYFASGLLFVSVTTLVLFFASGMYSEKIAYANQYVPHANRALRSFNMYLNVRKPPLTSQIPFNPLKFFFPRSPPSPSSQTRSPSRTRSSSTASPTSSTSSTTPQPIPTIPPASNPRGELIFSSRVDRAFREGYERHRTNFEKRREERERIERARKSWINFVRSWWKPPPTPTSSLTPTPTITGLSSTGANANAANMEAEAGPSGTLRRRTPPGSSLGSVKGRTRISRNSVPPEMMESAESAWTADNQRQRSESRERER